MRRIGKIFFVLTVLAAIFASVSIWILESVMFAVIGIVLFVFNAICTLCCEKRYKDWIIALLDLF